MKKNIILLLFYILLTSGIYCSEKSQKNADAHDSIMLQKNLVVEDSIVFFISVNEDATKKIKVGIMLEKQTDQQTDGQTNKREGKVVKSPAFC